MAAAGSQRPAAAVFPLECRGGGCYTSIYTQAPMRPILPAAFVLFAAMSAAALTPATESLLKDLGLDTQSSIIRAIAADKVTARSGEVYTLDSLAAKGDLAAVKSFLVTREFYHDFRDDPDIVFPNDELYNILYLAEPERVYMARKLMEGMPKTVPPKAAAKSPARKSGAKKTP